MSKTLTKEEILQAIDSYRSLSSAVLGRYVETFPNYAWTEPWSAVDLMAAEIKTLRMELGEFAQRIVTYFGDEDIPLELNCDIEIRDRARELVKQLRGATQIVDVSGACATMQVGGMPRLGQHLPDAPRTTKTA